MLDRVQIDPEKFAYEVMKSTTIKNEENMGDEEKAKAKLLQYLSAYFLVNKFNNLEEMQLDKSEKNHDYPKYYELIDKVSEMKWHR